MASSKPQAPREFDESVAALDTTLFDLVETQSDAKDLRSWLAVQRAVRQAKDSFVYLEIGSYLGGSLQYLQDPRCRRIYSIDNRTRDERHAENSEQAMLDNLRRAAPGGTDKLVCFASDARDVHPRAIDEAPDICFIDGEHTDRAVLSDFAFCLAVCAPDAAILFHDAGSTRPGIKECLRLLRRRAGLSRTSSRATRSSSRCGQSGRVRSPHRPHGRGGERRAMALDFGRGDEGTTPRAVGAQARVCGRPWSPVVTVFPGRPPRFHRPLRTAVSCRDGPPWEVGPSHRAVALVLRAPFRCRCRA